MTLWAVVMWCTYSHVRAGDTTSAWPPVNCERESRSTRATVDNAPRNPTRMCQGFPDTCAITLDTFSQVPRWLVPRESEINCVFWSRWWSNCIVLIWMIRMLSSCPTVGLNYSINFNPKLNQFQNYKFSNLILPKLSIISQPSNNKFAFQNINLHFSSALNQYTLFSSLCVSFSIGIKFPTKCLCIDLFIIYNLYAFCLFNVIFIPVVLRTASVGGRNIHNK